MIEVDQFKGIVALHRGDKHADQERGVEMLMEHGDNSKHTDREMRHFLIASKATSDPSPMPKTLCKVCA
jgi:hypothetical protein